MALLFPSSTSMSKRTLLKVVRAVSADEKNADNNNRINNMHSKAMSLGPIKSSPYIIILQTKSVKKIVQKHIIKVKN